MGQTPEQQINFEINETLGDKGGKINKNYSVVINGNRAEGDKFIKQTNKQKFPDYKSLNIGNMQNLNKEELKKFLKDSHPKHLDNVYLQYDNSSVDSIVDEMCETLKVVKNEIYLENMRFNEISLKSIMSSSAKANRLVLKDCYLGISKGFKGESADYQLSSMNMYSTFKNDSKTFEYFFSGMKRTGLENTKFELQLSEKDFGKKTKSKKGGKINEQEYELRVEENVLNELKDVIQGLSFTYQVLDAGEYTYEGQTVGKEIAGHGIYTHKKDKKAKRVHYSKDFVHQYEEITRPDGTTFKGYVRDGARHGLGIESNKKNKDKDDDEVFCLFIHDKMVHEFNDRDAREINKKNYKSVDYFKENKKSLKHVKDGQTFSKPEDFDLVMDEVEARIKHMHE